MSRRRRAAPLALAASLAVGAAAALTPSPAAAFCGFYVAGADAKLFNDATVVVLMRAGKRTVLSMQNDYQGPPERFALVIPVPVVLKEDDVKVLRPELFERVEALAAPRLVEYWEQDPCPTEGTIGLGNTGLIGKGGGGGTGMGYGRGSGLAPTVVVEAEFAVGEYEIVILSATESTGLDAWLRANKYQIPAGAEPLLRPYVAQGMKFFVAKVNPKKVKFDGQGRARLSPLRFHYESDEFALPIRLGLINAPDPADGGKQDLLVHILSPNQRYEVANYPNVTIPTNLDVTDAVREQFGAFYVSLFDDTLEQHPKAVVTEYAWGASSCDPCPGPDAALTAKELMELGGDVVVGQDVGTASVATIPNVRMIPPVVKGPLDRDIVRRITRAHVNEIRFCYNQGLRKDPKLAGRLEISAKIDGQGNVTRAEVATSTLSDPAVSACIAKATRRWRFPRPKGGASVEATIPFDLSGSIGSSRGRPSAFVLTRLHARYDASSLGEDLVFKTADPIVGGREIRPFSDGGERAELERGAQPSATNSFQGRYAIRHPWTGPIACQEPVRGIWGGPPAGQDGSQEPVVARRLSAAPRGGSLASFITAESAALLAAEGDAKAPSPAPAEAPAAVDKDAADASPPVAAEGAPPAAGAEAPATPAAGCGCATTEGERRGPGSLAALLALITVGRRRRRRRA
ncbi:MAG: DUF2330 domain-containing protein [Myxococcales bacterium]|nr:DUF2330 domain-containing protein [Myxococcales bacterium]